MLACLKHPPSLRHPHTEGIEETDAEDVAGHLEGGAEGAERGAGDVVPVDVLLHERDAAALRDVEQSDFPYWENIL